MLNKKEEVLEHQKSIGYKKHVGTCSDCSHFKIGKNNEVLNDVDRCVRTPNLFFRTKSYATCDNWIF